MYQKLINGILYNSTLLLTTIEGSIKAVLRMVNTLLRQTLETLERQTVKDRL